MVPKVSFLRLIDIPPDRIIARRGSVPGGFGIGSGDPIYSLLHSLNVRVQLANFMGNLKSVRRVVPAVKSGGPRVGIIHSVANRSLSSRSRSNLCTQFYCPDKSDGEPADWIRPRPSVRPPASPLSESIRFCSRPPAPVASPMSKCHFKRKSGPIEADS